MEHLFHDPAFWVALSFFATVALVIKPIVKALTGALDGRAGKIRNELDHARKLREDAQALLAEYQRKQRGALEEAEKIIEQANETAARIRRDAEAELETSIERRRKQALERIAQSEAAAVAQIRNTAVDMAIAATEKLITEKLGAKDDAKLIDAATGGLSDRLH